MSLPTIQATARRHVLSFLQRESPSSLLPSTTSLSTSAPVPSAFSSPSNPFLPTKTPGANSSRAPKYSLRRQKLLRQSIAALSWPANLLPPLAPSALSTTTTDTDAVAVANEVNQQQQQHQGRKTNLFRSSPHIPSTKVLDQLQLEKKGPYVGRKGAAFKGKIWERKMEKRTEELRVALEGADAREVAWRKGKSDVQAKQKTAMPF